MIAAVYARKSTEQRGVADDGKSVPRQIAGGRAFIERMGWTLDESHVYADDARSGALFAGREQFQRMKRDAAAGAFQVIVLFDPDRFARAAVQGMQELYALDALGIEVWDYSTGQAIDLGSMEGRISATLRLEFAQQFRESIRKSTRAAMRRKAEAGHVVGCRVYGYDNVRGEDKVVRRRINDAEADEVRWIYARYAAGDTPRAIAKALNRRGVAPPRRRGHVAGWAVSTVRAILSRPLYRGVYVYGKKSNAYGRELGRQSGRERGQVVRAEETWSRVEDASLRLIDERLAARVDARLSQRTSEYLAARKTGHRPERAHGKYLLSGGMLLCQTCGAHFEGRKWGRVYVCATRRRKPGACSNTLTLPIDDTDDKILSVIEGEILGTRYIDQLLSLLGDGPVDDGARLTAERDRLRAEVQHLVESIAAGVPADSVAPAIRDREAEIARLEVQIRQPRPVPIDRERLRAALEQRAAAWRADLRAEPQIARLVLRRLIGPLEMREPEEVPEFMQDLVGMEDGVRWEAEPKPAGLLQGLVQLDKSPT